MKYTAQEQGSMPDNSSPWEEMSEEELEMVSQDFDIFCKEENTFCVKANFDPKIMESIYQISPSYILEDWVMFKFTSDKTLAQLKSLIVFMYGSDKIYDFFPYKQGMDLGDAIDVNLFNKQSRLMEKLKSQTFNEEVNNEAYTKSNKLDFEDIALALEYDEYVVDEYHECIVDVHNMRIGNNFYFVASIVGSNYDVFDFFNDNFSLGFHYDKEVLKENIKAKHLDNIKTVEEFVGVEIESGININSGGNSFERNDKGYYIKGKDDTKQLTDFLVTLYYRIIHDDGRVEYLVKLKNPITGEETPEIIWSESLSATKFGQEISSYGNFHFFGTNNSITYIHQAISVQNVKPIKTVRGFGFFGDKLIFGNGIFDLKKKALTYSGGLKFLFDNEGDGYLPISRSGETFNENSKQKTANFYKGLEIKGADSIWKFFDSLYSTDKGAMLVMYIWGILGYGIHADMSKDKFLGLFIYGIKGSGKTEFNKIIARVFNMSLNPYSFNGITPFILTRLISHFHKIPIVFNEYRESTGLGQKDFTKKMDKFRTAFDKGDDARGTSDQKEVEYPCVAHTILDGEERIKDAANRSRVVNIDMSKKDRVPGLRFSEVVSSSEEIKNLLYSYLMMQSGSKEEYENHRKEGVELFSKIDNIEPRLAEGYALIYAGARMVYKNDNIGSILYKYCKSQNEELQGGTGHQELFSVIGSLMDRTLKHAYRVEGDYAYFSIELITSYFYDRKSPLTLQITEYMSYIKNAGYEVGPHLFRPDSFYGDSNAGMHDCFKVKIDKNMPLVLCKGAVCNRWIELKDQKKL